MASATLAQPHLLPAHHRRLGQRRKQVLSVSRHPPIPTRAHHKPLTALNLVLQIFVDIRFPITHRDHSRLCLSQALCHPLTRPLPLETLLLRVAPLPAPMPLPALTQRPTPALLLAQSQRPPAVCHQQQYRVHQIPTLPACRRSPQTPQPPHPPVAIGQRRRVFPRQHIPDARRCPPRRRLKSPLRYG